MKDSGSGHGVGHDGGEEAVMAEQQSSAEGLAAQVRRAQLVVVFLSVVAVVATLVAVVSAAGFLVAVAAGSPQVAWNAGAVAVAGPAVLAGGLILGLQAASRRYDELVAALPAETAA